MKAYLIATMTLAMFLGAYTADATLIGAQVDVIYINDGNPAGNANTSVIVQAGDGDAFQFGFSGMYGFTIDIEDSQISMLCTGGSCNATPDLGPAHYIFEGLDWNGEGFLIGASIDPLSDCGACDASVTLLGPTSLEVLFPDNANPGLGDSLIVNLQSSAVPEPSSIALLVVGFLGFGLVFAARRGAQSRKPVGADSIWFAVRRFCGRQAFLAPPCVTYL